jgi:hypothetical protein
MDPADGKLAAGEDVYAFIRNACLEQGIKFLRKNVVMGRFLI